MPDKDKKKKKKTVGDELAEKRRFMKKSGATKLMQKMRGKKPKTIKGAITKKRKK